MQTAQIFVKMLLDYLPLCCRSQMMSLFGSQFNGMLLYLTRVEIVQLQGCMQNVIFFLKQISVYDGNILYTHDNINITDKVSLIVFSLKNIGSHSHKFVHEICIRMFSQIHQSESETKLTHTLGSLMNVLR